MPRAEKGQRFGGRTKGTPNKRSAEMIAAAKKKGVTPLEYLLDIMHDTTKEDFIRFEAAKAAAPFLHAKLTSVHSTEGKTKSFEEWLSEIDATEAQK